MDSQVIRRLPKREPFQEFDIELTGGTTVRVWHPEWAIAVDGTVVVFDREAIPDIVYAEHIVRVRTVRSRRRK